MNMTRKGFLGTAAGGAIVLLLQACGGGDDEVPLTKCESSGASISGNHGHSLIVDVKDLDSLTDKTFSIAGSANHDHSVTFTPAQLKLLKEGKAVTVASTNNFQHAHNVIAACT